MNGQSNAMLVQVLSDMMRLHQRMDDRESRKDMQVMDDNKFCANRFVEPKKRAKLLVPFICVLCHRS